MVNQPSAATELSGAIYRIEPLGDQTRLHLKVNDQSLVMLIEPHTKLSQGEAVTVSLRNPIYFDGQGVRVR